MRRIKFPLLFGCVYRKFLEEVFINPANQVFFFAKRLVADLADLVDDLLDIVRCQVARGKGTFNKTTLQLSRSEERRVGKECSEPC